MCFRKVDKLHNKTQLFRFKRFSKVLFVENSLQKQHFHWKLLEIFANPGRKVAYICCFNFLQNFLEVRQSPGSTIFFLTQNLLFYYVSKCAGPLDLLILSRGFKSTQNQLEPQLHSRLCWENLPFAIVSFRLAIFR